MVSQSDLLPMRIPTSGWLVVSAMLLSLRQSVPGLAVVAAQTFGLHDFEAQRVHAGEQRDSFRYGGAFGGGEAAAEAIGAEGFRKAFRATP